MDPLIDQFKRDVERFEEKYSNFELCDTINKGDFDRLRAHHTQSTLNLVDRVIWEKEKMKRTIVDEFEELNLNFYPPEQDKIGITWRNIITSLSDTISKLQEFKEYLLEELKK